jgi:hypothetical protein
VRLLRDATLSFIKNAGPRYWQAIRSYWAFAQGWNLIARACDECNGYKSDLEDDLSAISMTAIVSEAHQVDEALQREGRRKAAGSKSRRTGKVVADSREELKIAFPLYGGAVAALTMTAPPQADQSRLFELARLHVIAFMYWLTYDPATRCGRFIRGGFRPVIYALRSDWGNARFRAFMSAVVDWEPRLLGDAASGYYRTAIRKHPTAACWSFAMEWNKNIRVAGFLGDETEIQNLVAALPRLKVMVIDRNEGEFTSVRTECPLNEADDQMFCWSSDPGSS